MRRYMQLAYLFHQRVKSLLSTDSRIADCTWRHPGVEHPFSSFDRLRVFGCGGESWTKDFKQVVVLCMLISGAA